MPNVRMPDGTVISNVPEGTTQSQLMGNLNTNKDHLIKKLTEANSKYELPEGVLQGIAQAESNFRPDIITGKTKSRVGAAGLMQFMPATAKEVGIDPLDPIQSIDGAGRYMSRLFKAFDGDIVKAVAAYNWGIGNVRRKGLEKAPEETRNYLKKVLGVDLDTYKDPKDFIIEKEEEVE